MPVLHHGSCAPWLTAGRAPNYHRPHRSTPATRNPAHGSRSAPARLSARHALPATCLAAALGSRARPRAPGRPAAQATGAVKYDLDDVIIHPVHALHGMVSSESALASDVGVEVLRKGGNAVDAAVAVGFALAVTMPNSGNIGGGGFMILHDGKTGKDTAIDFREMAPAAATRNMYLDDKGNVVAEQVAVHAGRDRRAGHRGRPHVRAGALRHDEARRRWSRRPCGWPARASRSARRWPACSPPSASTWARGTARARCSSTTARLPRRPATLLRNPDLAKSLRADRPRRREGVLRRPDRRGHRRRGEGARRAASPRPT